VESAEKDGYKDYNETCFSRKKGFLYSFTGLRGDSKRLYSRISKGEEKRVALVKCPTPEEQAVYVESADLVIWAAGY